MADDVVVTLCLGDEAAAFACANVQVRQMVNQFNQKSVAEGKTSLVEAGDPDGSLFLVNPEVRAFHWLQAGNMLASHPASCEAGASGRRAAVAPQHD